MTTPPGILDGIRTPDRRYIVVRGRLWRASNPNIPPDERAQLTKRLMAARRAVGNALRTGDVEAQRRARRRVDGAKRSLGERGPVWWTDGSPDLNRRLVNNTPYRDWYRRAERLTETIETLLARGSASVCPSDVARAAAPASWRSELDGVREIARHLARRGVLRISQRGAPLDPEAPFRGPIRLSLESIREPPRTR